LGSNARNAQPDGAEEFCIDMNETLTRRQVIGLVAAAPALLAERSLAASRPVDESGFVPIGGINQWLAIEGSDANNPVILFLHGGPGEAQSPFLKEFVPWETNFTVVNWDQRGSGRTNGKNGPSPSGMSTPDVALDRLCKDAREVAEYARKRLSKRKIVLVGHSWGTILGLHVVKRWPELFHAFVGTGQVVSWNLTLAAQERWARERATASGDQETLKALADTAALPASDRRRFTAPRKYVMAPSDSEYLKIQADFVGPQPTPTQGPVAAWVAGNTFSFSKLWPVISSFDARKLGLDIPVPSFVIQGRDDHVTPFEAAQSYVADIRAPRKGFIPIPGGHFACFTSPKAFVEALRQYVLPLAT
jgi:pimeloyl-ACP methyl ester carboxylesterase